MRVLSSLVVVVVLILALGAWFVLSGRVNVAAQGTKGGFLDKVLEETQEHSVKAQASRITEPDLASASVPLGAFHFREMCLTCHGGPGTPRSEIGEGLNPTPPDLTLAAQELKPREIYWIVQNGIRMTGMPAFGPTHNDRALRAMVAFVLRLPGMSVQEFGALAEAGEQGGGHEEEPPAPAVRPQ